MAGKKKQDDKESGSNQLRAEAAKKVARSAGKSAVLKKHDLDKLVHELQIHQVELAMQNEELSRSQEELEAAKKRYFDLYDLAPVGYFTISEQGIILEANLTGANMLGVVPRDLRTRQFSSLIFKADQDNFYLHRMQLFKTQAPQICEMRMVRKDGSLFWARVEATIAQDTKSGKSVCLASIGDLTSQKQSQESLRKSEEKHRLIIDNSLDMIYMLDADGKFLFASPAAQSTMGYSPSEIEGRSFQSFVHPDDVQGLEGEFVRFIEDGTFTPRFEYRVKHASGDWRWHNTSGNRVRVYDDDGSFLYFVGIAHDVTEIKLAQEDVKDSEAKYRLLAENTVDGVWLLDMNLNLMYCSPSSEKQSGFTLQEIMEMPLDKYFRPESLKVVAEAFLREIPKAESDPDYQDILTLELEFYKKDGTCFWAECKFSIIRAENGKPVSILGQGRDITERKLTEEKLLKSYESAKKTLNDAINTMVKIVEIRDPYTAGHQQKVADLATAIAREMKLEDARIDQLQTAAKIHDIGKMYVSSDILSKPGKLSEIEIGLIKIHSQSGYDIVKSMDFPGNVAQTVLQHHERLDGSGYPCRLKGEDTLLEAKILAVADVVEAMAAHRPYRSALGVEKALEEISKNRGKLYDTDVVDTCVGLFNSGKFKFKTM